jgi:hypothetical protein
MDDGLTLKGNFIDRGDAFSTRRDQIEVQASQVNRQSSFLGFCNPGTEHRAAKLKLSGFGKSPSPDDLACI